MPDNIIDQQQDVHNQALQDVAPTATADFTDYISNDAGDLVGKKIKSIPASTRDIGLDTTQKIISEIAAAGVTGKLDLSEFESFFTLSTDRNQLYQLIDTMAEDPIIAAAIEIYTEDACAAGPNGSSIWCASSDSEVQSYIDYLLKSLQINSHIYSWAYSFIKYGDLYLKLFRKSDLEDPLFDDRKSAEESQQLLNEALQQPKEPLHEDIKLVAHEGSDPFATYIEMVANPAELYELTRFGKTYAYVQADAPISTATSTFTNTMTYALKHSNSFRKKDVRIHAATDYVHAAYNDACNRDPEQIYLYMSDEDYDNDKNAYSYTVRRGKSLLCDAFKIWREITLLENSMVLNRLTKSSVLRIFNVEVGDMPKEQVNPHLAGVKSLVEQKSAFSVGDSMQEYVNPGPVENNIYIPQRNGIGSLSVQNIGGDVDVKGLGDVDYFKTKLYAILRIPKMFLGDTDDSAGFNGGSSLSIISSRYARAVKRIQQSLIDTITTVINIFLISRGLQNYIGRFELKMQSPVTQEELDKAAAISTDIQVRNDILSLAGDVADPVDRLKLEKLLLSSLNGVDPDVITLLDTCIEKAEKQAEATAPTEFDTPFDGMSSGGMSLGGGSGFSDVDFSNLEPVGSDDTERGATAADTASDGSSADLPSPADLGVDFTDM